MVEVARTVLEGDMVGVVHGADCGGGGLSETPLLSTIIPRGAGQASTAGSQPLKTAFIADGSCEDPVLRAYPRSSILFLSRLAVPGRAVSSGSIDIR